jgi:hypothetical protein
VVQGIIFSRRYKNPFTKLSPATSLLVTLDHEVFDDSVEGGALVAEGDAVLLALACAKLEKEKNRCCKKY